MKKNNFAVIMAGGVGSRFWPMSQENRPKQFLDVLGIGRTLIQMTYDRLLPLVPENQIFVVTNQHYAGLVEEQLGIDRQQILTEPMRKNTAPAIAYAAHKIYSLNKDANLIVASSDHLILKEAAFIETVQKALNFSESGDYLVTLGLKPTRPDTGYGYIQFERDQNLELGTIKPVKKFTEKPDINRAQQFVDSGEYFWNSGIFIWKAISVINAIQQFKPELHALFMSTGSDYNTPAEQDFINRAFTACEDISIDFAILENAKNVFVVLADLGWSDLGTWGSLYTHLKHDSNGNAVVGNEVNLFESSNNIIHLPKGKMALIQGLDGYIVVESSDILMIVKKEDEQKIKNYVNEILGKK